MKIAELLSVPASAARDDHRDAATFEHSSCSSGDDQAPHASPPRARKLDMASLDRFAQQ